MDAKPNDAMQKLVDEARAEAQMFSAGRGHLIHRLADTLDAIHDNVLSRVPSEVLSERDAKVRAEVIDWIEGDNRGLVNRAVSAAREHFGLTKGADRG